ncbi:MAG TPA: HU family DNA-binding protein [Candidatus Barnesiella excrementipullorum]|uniref:HU family DNA-binding protein n=1 Tax=Candidatus Barnesiella excrementipullorum TaxID=2838479 RepID=A0A9D1VQT9_9BACT|nr:HU family DNA-binding protein [Candidatus Barnesiella excrementipullorum]
MNQKLTLPDVAEWVARRQGCSKREAELFLREMASLTADTLASGEALKIEGLGTFKPVWVEARTSINVQTGEPSLVPGHYKLVFTPEKRVRDVVNEPFSCFSAEVLPDEADLSDLPVADAGRPDDDTDDPDEEPVADDTAGMALPDGPEKGHDTTPSLQPAAVAREPQSVEEPVAGPQSDGLPAEVVATPDPDVEVDTPAVTGPVDGTIPPQTEQPLGGESVGISASDEQPGVEAYSPNVADLLHRERMRGFWIGAAVAATITALVLLSIYIVWHRPFAAIGEEKQAALICRELPAAQTDTPATVTLVSDSATLAATDSADKSVAASVVESPVAAQAVTDTLSKGEFLTTLSLRHYGHKAFWVYIFDANREKIPNPDNVEAGTVLIIPPRERYGIDAADSVSVQKALGIADSLKSKR